MISAQALVAHCPNLTQAQAVSLLRGPGRLDLFPPFAKDLEISPGPCLILLTAALLSFEHLAEKESLYCLLDFFADGLLVAGEVIAQSVTPPTSRLSITDRRYVTLFGPGEDSSKLFDLEAAGAAETLPRRELKIELYNLTSLLTQRGKAIVEHAKQKGATNSHPGPDQGQAH